MDHQNHEMDALEEIRSRGKQKTRWRDDIQKITKSANWYKMAQNHQVEIIGRGLPSFKSGETKADNNNDDENHNYILKNKSYLLLATNSMIVYSSTTNFIAVCTKLMIR